MTRQHKQHKVLCKNVCSFRCKGRENKVHGHTALGMTTGDDSPSLSTGVLWLDREDPRGIEESLMDMSRGMAKLGWGCLVLGGCFLAASAYLHVRQAEQRRLHRSLIQEVMQPATLLCAAASCRSDAIRRDSCAWPSTMTIMISSLASTVWKRCLCLCIRGLVLMHYSSNQILVCVHSSSSDV